MRLLFAAATLILLQSCGHDELYLQPVDQQKTAPKKEEEKSLLASVPSVEERRTAAKGVLSLLANNITAGKLDYRFNASGEGVCLATAGLAFIGSGSTIDHGPCKEALSKVFGHIREIMENNNFKLQPTWGCAQSTIFLSELHRTASPQQRPAIAALLIKYVEKLVASQTVRGSWCHTFEDVKNQLNYDDLMAVSVMAMQGLGMARREGLAIDQQIFIKGLTYIENSSDVSSGHIGYSPRVGQRGMAGPGRTGGGLLALNACNALDLPLAKSAASYLAQSFMGSELNTGHASAQLGQAWAAWWAAENGVYERFWAGQGATIMARRKPDGGFHCAPTDGKAGDPISEKGDFANAMHALMLIAGDGLILSGLAKENPRAALSDAMALVESWGPNTPASLRALADLNTKTKAVTDSEIVKQLVMTVKELAKVTDEQSAQAIIYLLSASVSVQATFDQKSRRIIGEIFVSPGRLPNLAKAKLSIIPIADVMVPVPSPRSFSLTTKAQRFPLTITAKSGSQPPEFLDIEVKWELSGLPYTQLLKVPLSPQKPTVSVQ